MKNLNKNSVTLTLGMTLLFAISGGLSVANLYYNQPLLVEIAKTFNTTSHNTGLISTFTQLGYALGIFLFVPLGDIKEKKKIILILMGLVVIALLGVATAKTILWMYFSSFVVGLTNISPQIMIPLATELADSREKGKVVGIIVSGLLIGILLARTISGFIGYIFGWRSMFIFASLIMFILLIVLFFKLPKTKPNVTLTYKNLLKSVLRLIAKYPILRQASLLGAFLFGAFSNFWTTLTFMLQSPYYNMNTNQIGLFGLIGIVGALGASLIGRLNDKKESTIIIRLCIVLSIISYFIFQIFSLNLAWVIIGIILLDFGIQGAQVSNQTKIYSINPDERSRLNTVFIVSNFIGAAIGSLLGSWAWNLYKWNGVCLVGLIMLLVALIINVLYKES